MAAAALAAVATLSQKLGGEHEQTVLNIVVKSFSQLGVLPGRRIGVSIRIVFSFSAHRPASQTYRRSGRMFALLVSRIIHHKVTKVAQGRKSNQDTTRLGDLCRSASAL
jgi:hypothetical protein